MTAYKLVTIQFKWWGLQDRVENFIHSTETVEEYQVAQLYSVAEASKNETGTKK